VFLAQLFFKKATGIPEGAQKILSMRDKPKVFTRWVSICFR